MLTIPESRMRLQELLERYNKHKDDKNFIGNEKQACQSLIVPLIHKVLGWDTENPSEFKAEVSQSGKRIDYVVLNQGISQFIVEAKAPSKDIFQNDSYYKQALEYGYGKEKDFAILTNFKQLVILACQTQWRMPQEAELARINLLTATDDDLKLLLTFEKEYWTTTAKENLLYSKLVKHKRAIPVDERLLDDMRNWREQLLRNIKANISYNRFDFEDEQEFMHVEEGVQKFIDRMIFICFCEDKELQDPHLKSLMHDKQDRFALTPGWLLEKIRDVFAEYRSVYDSDLFDKSDCDTFKIDDDKLLDVIEQLRVPKGKAAYDFKSIEADILGKTYEDFIGHIQKGKKRFTEQEDKGKRKKGGIYYTPKYIVDYIVNNTVREHIKNKSFEDIKKIRILDPACGSGSFLRVAFDVLVEESQKTLKRDLTYEEKKELLLNCIYGVDVDERAVEIAKFNLSLKLAERGKPLPKLRNNIRNGNSLIDDKSILKYGAFVWQDEFKEIMDSGGFDVIIGNPPYINIYHLAKNEEEMRYYQQNYFSATKKFDIYILFMELAFKKLKEKEIFSFIIPNKFLTQPYAQKIRKYILDNMSLLKILDLSNIKVFKSAQVDNVVLIISNKKSWKNIVTIETVIGEIKRDLKIEKTYVPQYLFSNEGNYIISTKIGSHPNLDKKCLDNSVPLSEIAVLNIGVTTGNDTKYITNSPTNNYKKYLRGANIKRYFISFTNMYLNYIPKKLYRPRFQELFENEKIIISNVGKDICASYDDNNYYIDNSSCLVLKYKLKSVLDLHRRKIRITSEECNLSEKFDIKYILGLLNSKLMNWFYQIKYSDGLHVLPDNLKKLPIKIATASEQNRISTIVIRILKLNNDLSGLGDKKTEQRIRLEEEIKKANQEIDDLIYKLYNITEEEKKIIEDSLK